MADRVSVRYDSFDTGGVPPHERFAFWRDCCMRRFEPTGSAGAVGKPFGASVRRLVGPTGAFTYVRVTASGVRRTARMCRADDVDDLVVGIGFGSGGNGWLGSPDRTFRQASREVRLFDYYSQPSVTEWAGQEHRGLFVDLPRTAFDARTLSRILAADGARLAPGGLAPLLAAQMQTLSRIAPGLAAPDREAGLRAVLDLTVTVLRREFGKDSAESDVCEDGMFVAAQALIRRQFGSPDLTPETLARRLGCSRAHLYRLFGRHQLTVAGFIRDTRLQQCRAALATGSASETIGDIAFRCGFENPVHFARLFRQRFGMRPSDVFRRGLAPDRFQSGFRMTVTASTSSSLAGLNRQSTETPATEPAVAPDGRNQVRP
jgi:AraC-like DNA-binding protein